MSRNNHEFVKFHANAQLKAAHAAALTKVRRGFTNSPSSRYLAAVNAKQVRTVVPPHKEMG